MTRRVVVLVDGEHYPPVVVDALGRIGADGDDVVAAVFIGGTEKVDSDSGDRAPALAEVAAVAEVVTGRTPSDALASALERFAPDAVIDLSDAPVVTSRSRLDLAARSLVAGTSYVGTDFRVDPPPRPMLANRPSAAVVGTGKRTGKTAVAASVARIALDLGRSPVIVAMGRGGPETPEVIRPHEGGAPDVRRLIEWSMGGRHAASDHVEDALMTGVTTVGTRRCGGGLAGAVGPNNFAEGLEVGCAEADRAGHDLILLEGSGSAMPPAHADATVLVIPAAADPEEVCGYLGPYRLLMADLIVVTGRRPSPELLAGVRRVAPDTPVVETALIPTPLAPVAARSVVLATTAPDAALDEIAASVEANHGAAVVGVTNALSDRPRLRRELAALLPRADVLLTELKGAAIDVAATMAVDGDTDVVFLDNVPSAESDALRDAVRRLIEIADANFEADEPRQPIP